MAGTVKRAQLLDLVATRGAQLIEVLPKDEYDEEHLHGAIHMPLKSLTAARKPRWTAVTRHRLLLGRL